MKLRNTAIALGVGAATAAGLSLLKVDKPIIVGSTAVVVGAGLMIALKDKEDSNITSGRLTGKELLEKIESLGDVSKSDLVRECGYVSKNDDGEERLQYTAFYEAFLDAKNIGVEENESIKEEDITEEKKVLEEFSEGCNKLEVEDYEGAINVFNKIIVAYPNFVPAYVNRGISEINIDKFDDAINDLNKAIKLDKSSSIAYLHRGFAKQQLNDFEGAYEDWKMSDQVSQEGNEDAVQIMKDFAQTIESLEENQIDDSLKSIAKKIREYTNKDFSKDEKVYESNNSYILNSGDSVIEHRTRINNILLDFWKFTPFAETNPIPTMISSENENGSINFSYCLGTADKPDRSKESLFYTIDNNGIVKVEESNEVLNLNDMQHIFTIVSTIISDIYGDYDYKEVMNKYLKNIPNQLNNQEKGE